MYRVYADNNLLYDQRLDDYAILDATLELELNKTGTFSFVIYPKHPHYADLQKLKSIVAVYKGNDVIFRGRILNSEEGFYNEKKVECEGELAFLLDSIVRPYSFQGSPTTYFGNLISAHNAQVGVNQQFKLGNVTVQDDNDYIARANINYPNTWDEINDKLINSLGGYLWVRHEADGNYIDYLNDFDKTCTQKIEFAQNLLDFNRVVKGDDIATAIIPLGAKGENEETRLTISAVNDGVDYVYNQQAVDAYGWIFKTVEWDDVTLASNLLRKANEYLADSVNLLVSIDLNAFDMAALDSSIDAFHLGEYVSVKSNVHGIDANYLVRKMTLNLLSPTSNTISLGASYSTFSEQVNNSTKNQITTILNVDANVQTLAGDTSAQLTILNGNIQAVSADIVELQSNITTFAANIEATDDLTTVKTNLQINGQVVQPDRMELTLQNGWVNYGGDYESAVCWVDKCEIVHIAGMIKSGTVTAATVLSILPIGYRPRATERLCVVSATGICCVDIAPDGSLSMVSGASPDWVSLSNITFRRT